LADQQGFITTLILGPRIVKGAWNIGVAAEGLLAITLPRKSLKRLVGRV